MIDDVRNETVVVSVWCVDVEVRRTDCIFDSYQMLHIEVTRSV